PSARALSLHDALPILLVGAGQAEGRGGEIDRAHGSGDAGAASSVFFAHNQAVQAGEAGAAVFLRNGDGQQADVEGLAADVERKRSEEHTSELQSRFDL